LAVADFVEGDDDGLINGPAIVQENTRDLLDSFDAELV
jgi:hypothetical protein